MLLVGKTLKAKSSGSKKFLLSLIEMLMDYSLSHLLLELWSSSLWNHMLRQPLPIMSGKVRWGLSASQTPLKRCSGARLSPGVGRLERSIGLDKLVQWNQLTLWPDSPNPTHWKKAEVKMKPYLRSLRPPPSFVPSDVTAPFVAVDNVICYCSFIR